MLNILTQTYPYCLFHKYWLQHWLQIVALVHTADVQRRCPATAVRTWNSCVGYSELTLPHWWRLIGQLVRLL